MPIGLKAHTTKRTIYSQKLKKEAITEYKLVKSFKDKNGNIFSLLKVYPQTGRTHQIRVHLKSIGCPILGDKLYGLKKDKLSNLMLHALSLEFEPYKNKIIKIECEPDWNIEKL